MLSGAELNQLPMPVKFGAAVCSAAVANGAVSPPMQGMALLVRHRTIGLAAKRKSWWFFGTPGRSVTPAAPRVRERPFGGRCPPKTERLGGGHPIRVVGGYLGGLRNRSAGKAV